MKPNWKTKVETRFPSAPILANPMLPAGHLVKRYFKTLLTCWIKFFHPVCSRVVKAEASFALVHLTYALASLYFEKSVTSCVNTSIIGLVGWLLAIADVSCHIHFSQLQLKFNVTGLQFQALAQPKHSLWLLAWVRVATNPRRMN